MSEQQLATRQDKAPIAANQHGLMFSSLEDMWRFATAYASSGMAPKGDTPQALIVKMQHGMEIGLPPAQAIQGIAVINGRPCVWGDHALGIVQAHQDFEDIEETIDGKGENAVASCTVKRKGRSQVTRRFSVADAKAAGLWKKGGPWTQYPERMLQMRARGFALRDSFADALKGIGIREEVQDIPAPRPITKARLIVGDEPSPAALPEQAEQTPEPADQDGFTLTGDEQDAV